MHESRKGKHLCRMIHKMSTPSYLVANQGCLYRWLNKVSSNERGRYITPPPIGRSLLVKHGIPNLHFSITYTPYMITCYKDPSNTSWFFMFSKSYPCFSSNILEWPARKRVRYKSTYKYFIMVTLARSLMCIAIYERRIFLKGQQDTKLFITANIVSHFIESTL